MPFTNFINPVLLSLGPVEIRYYGLVYVLGALLTLWYLEHHRKKGSFPLTKEENYDFVFYLLLGLLIGSRLFEVFWDPRYYLSNPLHFFEFWIGGMSFHGGLVGTALAGYLFCCKKKISIWQMADIVVIPVVFTLALGRLANFTNSELWGTVTNVSWCVYFPLAGEKIAAACRHPYVLYEALKRFAILGVLLFLSKEKFKEKLKPGTVFLSFVILENLGRFFLDFLKEDSHYLGFTPGQYLAAILFFLGLYFMFKFWKKEKITSIK
ncbi:prolipoprotein diacylglyceryl transferase [Candidatus Woesearchaeota archaeon]|nr:prolipoprotein diacylglyceryl transferase [Candidatus Woesearchaeota archaeon]